jgi:HEPN domain-containing protein
MSAVRSYRLVMLLELLELKAEPFWRLSCLIGQMVVRLETSLPPLEQVVNGLGELQREVQRLGLRSADAQLNRIRDLFFGDKREPSLATLGPKLHPLVLDLHLRILDELADTFFISIPSENVNYYNPAQPLFGQIVLDTFPNAAEDIDEGGKCYALGRYTAVIFHLMRALEISLHALANKLGATVTNKHGDFLPWGVLLANIGEKIDQMPRGDEKADWSEAHALLHHVNQAWRTGTMHPKQTYTQEQAEDIIDAVKSFMRRLAPLVAVSSP